MSRTGWGSADFLRATAPLTAYPFSFGFWFNAPDFGSQLCFGGLFNSTAGAINQNAAVILANASEGLQFRVADAGSNNTATAAASWVPDVWNHGCAVAAGATDRAVFLNGGNKGTSTTSRTPSGIDRFSLGRWDNGGAAQNIPSTTLLAEVAVWNIALTEADVAMLGAAGASPLRVRPSALVAYWPLFGAYSPEIELIGRRELAVQGTLTAAPHPRLLRPMRRRPGRLAYAAPTPPVSGVKSLSALGVG